MKKRTIIALLLSVMLAGAAACNVGQTGTTQELVKVTRGDLALTVSGSGSIEVPNDQKLAFDIPGKIDRVYVKEGDRVRKGAPVASLTTEALQLAVKQAEVGRAQAEAAVIQAQASVKAAELALSLALMQNIPDDAAIKRLQVEAARQARTAAEQAAALADDSLAEAKRQLDAATLVAGFDGIIGRLNVKAGDTVSPMVVVAEIVDPSEMRLKVQVDEIDIASVRVGQTASLQVDALPSLEITGNVTAIALLPTLLTGVVTYDATVSFTPPPASGLRIGMSATADIVTARRTGVLLIPERAVGQNSQGQTVVKVQANGKTEERIVVVGITDGIQTEVISGLSEGETVVVERAAQQSGGFF